MEFPLTELLFDRYPDLHFLITYHPYELKGEKQLHDADIEKEVAAWHSKLPLDRAEILYIYGIGLGHYYAPVKAWLAEKRERALVFLEDDIGALAAFANGPHCDTLLSDPKVHIRFLQKESADVEDLARAFPSDKVEVSYLAAYKKMRPKKCQRLELKLQRRSFMTKASVNDILYSHYLFKNLTQNFLRIAETFNATQWKDRFKNVPAIICGAGPSLERAAPILKTVEQRALVIAGGSTLTALSHLGIRPHIAMALDPNHQEIERLRPSTQFDVPLIYSNRLYPEVFDICNGPFGYLRSDTGGSVEEWMQKELGLDDPAVGHEMGAEAFSVTTLAVAYAYHMGCNPIILTGVDLAFTSGSSYAPGIVADPKALTAEVKEKKLRRKDRHGRYVTTLVKWVMESEAIGTYAKKHPDRQFLNATDEGIGFPHIDYQPLEQAVQQHCTQSLDLRGYIHEAICQTAMPPDFGPKVKSSLASLGASLKRCVPLVSQMILELEKKPTEENSMMTLLNLDFQEESAYEPLFKNIELAFDLVMARHFKNPFEQALAKWKHLEMTLESVLKTLN